MREKMTEYPKYDHYKKVLKGTTTFLKRWNGGTAMMVTITTSHATLIIDIYKKGNDGWLRLSCIDPQWIQGFRIWENCNIELKVNIRLKNGEIGFILVDEKAELEIHCAAFSSSEHLPKKKSK
jgi:hypothetical protein